MIPLLEGLERVAHRLAPSHLSRAARARVVATAEGLPDAWYCAALESRLSSDEERVDLLVCARSDDGGRDALLRGLPGLIAASPDGGEAWRRIEDFCLGWASEGSLAHSDVPFIWLEWDLPLSRARPAQPFLFFCVQPDFLLDPLAYGKTLEGDERTEARQLRLIDEAVGLLLGRATWAPALRQVERCLKALPLDGHLLHVAALAQRGVDAIRLVLTLPHEGVLTYLEAVGWSGPVDEVRSMLATLHRESPLVGVQLDVGEEVGGALGIQFYFQGPDPRWGPLFDGLVERRLLSPAKRDLALGWSGVEPVRFPSRAIALELRRELEVKLVYRPDQPTEAKAYFGFGADFVLFAAPAPPA